MAEDVLLYRTRSYLKKHFGGRDKLYPFMELNTVDMVVWGPYDFIDNGANGDCTDLLGEHINGGSITGTVANTVNGICQITTSASQDKYVGVFPNGGEGLKGAIFKGANSPVVWARVHVDVITSMKMEVGFTDAETDNGGAVNVLGSSSTNANDCAVWCFDTLDGLFWQGVHAKGTQSGSKVEPGKHSPSATSEAYEWLGVAIQGENVKFMHMDSAGTPDYESGWQATGITSTVSLIPFIYVKTLNGTEKKLDIDYWIAWQRRYATDD